MPSGSGTNPSQGSSWLLLPCRPNDPSHSQDLLNVSISPFLVKATSSLGTYIFLKSQAAQRGHHRQFGYGLLAACCVQGRTQLPSSFPIQVPGWACRAARDRREAVRGWGCTVWHQGGGHTGIKDLQGHMGPWPWQGVWPGLGGRAVYAGCRRARSLFSGLTDRGGHSLTDKVKQAAC